MRFRHLTGMMLAAVCLTGCAEHSQPAPQEHTEETAAGTQTAPETTTEATTTTETTTTAPPPEPYKFNPHVYSPMFGSVIPQENWDAFYSLCDALRAGETTFACAGQEAYEWATDSVVLGHLFPAACMKITGESKDGTVPCENGTGRIYYTVPIAEFTARQAEFEETVTAVLNGCLEPDDDDFEKCLKLYRYIESTYTYESIPEGGTDGAQYSAIMEHKGICSHFSGVYAYFLMQVGIDATDIGCFAPDMCHAWTYVVLNGQGYHVDPTWALMSDRQTDKLLLEYFMMTDERRAETGCPVDDLTVDLLPEYWVNRSSLKFPATDDRYYMKDYSELDSLDEQTKTVHYTDMNGDSHELHYGASEK